MGGGGGGVKMSHTLLFSSFLTILDIITDFENDEEVV